MCEKEKTAARQTGPFNSQLFPSACAGGGWVRFSILSCLIFKCNVDGGIPSLAAAPFGPATFPLLSARAASTSSFS